MSTRERIFDVLRKKGKNQSQLARQLNLSRQLVSKWRIGDSLAYYKYINEIADFLDVSPDYLMGTSKDENEKPCELNSSRIEFALKNPAEFDNDVYDDVKKYSNYIKKKYKFKKDLV